MSANLFLVPHDFTSVGDTALSYALSLAKPKKTKIILLHIISNDSEEKAVVEKLKAVIDKLPPGSSDVPIEPKALKGNIFDGIPDYAKETDAQLIIMGTHGAVGMQKVFGSYAMKVVTKSSTPILVVQDGYKWKKPSKVLIPINFSKESLQVIPIAGAISNMFNSEITIIAEKYADPILYSKLKVRFTLIEKQYADFHYNIKLLKLKKSLQKEIVDYAKENEFDLIAISHDDSSLFPQFDRFTQSLLVNQENIPCLIVNAKLLTSIYY